MKTTEYRIDGYTVEIYSSDLKGARTRWGEKIIRLYSGDHVDLAESLNDLAI